MNATRRKQLQVCCKKKDNSIVRWQPGTPKKIRALVIQEVPIDHLITLSLIEE
jgi:hypothetical protein